MVACSEKNQTTKKETIYLKLTISLPKIQSMILCLFVKTKIKELLLMLIYITSFKDLSVSDSLKKAKIKNI